MWVCCVYISIHSILGNVYINGLSNDIATRILEVVANTIYWRIQEKIIALLHLYWDVKNTFKGPDEAGEETNRWMLSIMTLATAVKHSNHILPLQPLWHTLGVQRSAAVDYFPAYCTADALNQALPNCNVLNGKKNSWYSVLPPSRNGWRASQLKTDRRHGHRHDGALAADGV